MACRRLRVLGGLVAVMVVLPWAEAQAPKVPPGKHKAPDLIVAHIGATTQRVLDRYGQMVGGGFLMGLCNTVRVRIKNSSSRDATQSFSVRLFYAKMTAGSYRDTEDFEQELTVTGLGAGQTKTLDFTNWKLTKALKGADYYIVAQIDSRKQVIEGNEYNNEKSLFLASDRPDWDTTCPRKKEKSVRRPVAQRV